MTAVTTLLRRLSREKEPCRRSWGGAPYTDVVGLPTRAL
jgi:hypothetical protein